MLLEALTPQPSCPNKALIYICQLNFPSFFIQWEHTTFRDIAFFGGVESVGNIMNTSDGRVVANLTMNDASNNPVLFLLSSTLTINPSLNNSNNTNLNSTMIRCAGSAGSQRTAVAPVLLDGK